MVYNLGKEKQRGAFAPFSCKKNDNDRTDFINYKIRNQHTNYCCDIFCARMAGTSK